MSLDPEKCEITDEAKWTVQRKMTPVDKLAIVNRMWEIGRDLVRDALRQSHPEWNEVQLAEETAKSMLRGDAERFSKLAEQKAWEEILERETYAPLTET